MEKFNSYAFSDFLDDDSFIRFVKNDQSDDHFIWLVWLNTHPANINDYNDARNYLITVLSAIPVLDSEKAKADVWAKIEAGISVHERRATKIRRLRQWSISAAAAILIFLGCSWYYEAKVILTTGNGEQVTVKLPDNSTVKLNANSTLTYYRAWGWHNKREVWINGEALFKIIHLNHQANNIKPGEQFIAHADLVNIQVLGTTFDIKNRHKIIDVSLIQGKVSVQNLAAVAEPVMLKPGEAIEYRAGEPHKMLITQMANKPLAWTNEKMVLSGMTVAGIIQNFEDTYGGKIVLDNPALLNKRIDGTISMRTRESTLYMLANLLNATVQQQDSIYYLNAK